LSARAAAVAIAAAAIAAAAISTLGCLGPGDFRCERHSQCGSGASCEITGRCSVPAPKCPSRRRFVGNAGSASDMCVPPSCGENALRTIVAGGAHACALRADGSVGCWGRNDDGQLGDGTRTPRSLPAAVSGLTATAIAAGQRHTCAVRSGGTVACWGADDAGQLGDGGGVSRDEPVAVANLTGAVSVAAGADFSCAVLNDGTVRCWGADDVGQLGDEGAAAATRLPSPVAFLDGVRTVSAFWRHACAVRDDETLWCWGANNAGQIGNGTIVDQRRPVRVPTLMAVRAAGTGQAHSCAVTRAAGLFCWGDNAASQLGSTEDGPVTAPARVPFVSDPIAVAVGLQHTCAIRNGGAVFCWGQNDRGQLGQGSMAILSSPVSIKGLDTGVAVAAGAAFSCARTVDGAAFCWGDNHFGQLAIGTDVLRARPTEVPGLLDASAVGISAGTGHTCVALRNSVGDVVVPSCWGANQAGQLGDGAARNDRASAKPITPEILASTIAAGGAHTCAIDSLDTRLWCWGRGNLGQLGSSPLIDKPPSQVPVLTAVTAVAAGGAHTCAVAGGAVSCFGSNVSGQLGDGTTTDRTTPPASAPLGAPGATAVAVATGASHTCAVDSDGKVWCWGNGADGQLGYSAAQNATPGAVPLPPVTPGSGVLSAGGAHTCAVTAAGELRCWGRFTPTAAPAPASGIIDVPGAFGVASGGDHACAIAGGDRHVECFGANDYGQLGDGGTTASVTPVTIEGLDDVEELAAGALHTCARRANGKVACWGANTSGQLGDGTPLTLPIPQLARINCHPEP